MIRNKLGMYKGDKGVELSLSMNSTGQFDAKLRKIENLGIASREGDAVNLGKLNTEINRLDKTIKDIDSVFKKYQKEFSVAFGVHEDLVNDKLIDLEKKFSDTENFKEKVLSIQDNSDKIASELKKIQVQVSHLQVLVTQHFVNHSPESGTPEYSVN